ncbi:MAG: hypothetical protein HQK50_13870 [Oligoflexia bacterium]|nr:hypothetical protein [Oligoflexia bacterium]
MSDVEPVAIHELTMPPGHPLSDKERALLSAWISAGAPEMVAGTIISTPEPEPEPSPITPLIPSFASLKANIFDKKCTVCHFAAGPIKDILFEREEQLINSPRDLVIPGEAEESGLFISVSRQDSKRMPPASSNLDPLSLQEIETIKQWINETLEGAR